MARSEIDDIFAAKKSTAKVTAQPVASTSAPTDATGSKKKKKDKKRKRQAEEPQDSGVNEEKPRKKRLVETVHDTSTTVPKTVKPGKVTKPKAAKKEKEDLDRFKDSRGTGPRKLRFSCGIHCRLTGYQDGKLRRAFRFLKKRSWGLTQRPVVRRGVQRFPQCVTDLCPGTPLCPFDCDCC